ncbi:MAG: caspase family protein [Staphylococcus sp.]|nr:caspase family protein [Staphylococcus sp.]
MSKILLVILLTFPFVSHAYNLDRVNDALQDLKNGDVATVITKLKKSSAMNDLAAQHYLGQCYEHGIGVEKDSKQAFLMYRRAAERGFAPAMEKLSQCYRDGIGVMINKSRSDEWLARFDKRNDGSSIPDIVAIYSMCDTVHKDLACQSSTVERRTADEKPVSVAKNQQPTAYQYMMIGSHSVEQESTIPAKPISDVDVDIPRSSAEKSTVFALIIANEDYQDVAAVPNALNDGDVMAKYCQFTLGLPPTNIHLIKNATLNNIRREINIISKIAEAYKGEASFLVYYAGHGVPDEATRDAFLLPVDGYVADMTTCYKLSDFYHTLGQMPSLKTIVMLDACFSGASRQGDMLASARGVSIKSKPATPTGNMVVISSATGDETAYPYSEQQHGLFTYYLLRKLKDSNGKVTIADLFDFVSDNVTKKSIVINGKSQTPTVVPSQSLDTSWKNWTLN